MTGEVMQALLPCPFCGGEARWVEDTGALDTPFGFVTDHSAGCFLGSHMMGEWKTILAAWNARAPSTDAEERKVNPMTDPEVNWLVHQLEAWPGRVYPNRTTNIQYLMQEAAKIIRRTPLALAATRTTAGVGREAPGWDVDGICNDHERYLCADCAIVPPLKPNNREAIEAEVYEKAAKVAEDNRTDDDSMWDRACVAVAAAIRACKNDANLPKKAG